MIPEKKNVQEEIPSVNQIETVTGEIYDEYFYRM